MLVGSHDVRTSRNDDFLISGSRCWVPLETMNSNEMNQDTATTRIYFRMEKPEFTKYYMCSGTFLIFSHLSFHPRTTWKEPTEDDSKFISPGFRGPHLPQAVDEKGPTMKQMNYEA